MGKFGLCCKTVEDWIYRDDGGWMEKKGEIWRGGFNGRRGGEEEEDRIRKGQSLGIALGGD